MTIKNFQLLSFEDKKSDEALTIEVPEGSRLLQFKVLHDGIHGWYEIPSIETKNIVETYKVIRPNTSIPVGAEFITVLDTIIDTPKGQGVMVFPIYKLKV